MKERDDMYFPYLRGRQFELIALRELVEKDVLSSKIIPVIEPVKLSSTLLKTIEMYGNNNKKLAFITNPGVGSFKSEWREEKNKKLKENLKEYLKENDNILYMHILKPHENQDDFINKHAESMGTICDNRDAILADKFNKQNRNNDYIRVDDEPFSEDHLFYSEDGYVGFSDYSVVGKDYSETGFAPYAVAIHIVYFDEDKSLRIKHFVSDSNDDISDQAGKFQEALTKLIVWNKEKRLNTVAMREFEGLYEREAYPGLGTVKKLTIMHHLELIGQYLDEE